MANKERVKLLVDALRSGEYQQTRTQLTKVYPDGELRHCCLGVACQVAIANGFPLEVEYFNEFTLSYNASTSVLPDSVRRWYGFDSDVPYITIEKDNELRPNTPASLANDSLELSFAEIADGFERTYLSKD